MNASILLLVLLERTKNTIKLKKKKIGLDLFWFVTVFFLFSLSLTYFPGTSLGLAKEL